MLTQLPGAMLIQRLWLSCRCRLTNAGARRSWGPLRLCIGFRLGGDDKGACKRPPRIFAELWEVDSSTADGDVLGLPKRRGLEL